MDKQINILLDMIENEDDAQQRQIWNTRSKERRFEKQEKLNTIIKLQSDLKELQSSGNRLRTDLSQTLQLHKLLMDSSNDKQALDLRLKLKGQLRTLIKQIKIYPLMEPYEPIKEIEPDIYQIMKSKSIDKIVIRFAGANKLRVIPLKSFADGMMP